MKYLVLFRVAGTHPTHHSQVSPPVTQYIYRYIKDIPHVFKQFNSFKSSLNCLLNRTNVEYYVQIHSGLVSKPLLKNCIDAMIIKYYTSNGDHWSMKANTGKIDISKIKPKFVSNKSRSVHQQSTLSTNLIHGYYSHQKPLQTIFIILAYKCILYY